MSFHELFSVYVNISHKNGLKIENFAPEKFTNFLRSKVFLTMQLFLQKYMVKIMLQ